MDVGLHCWLTAKGPLYRSMLSSRMIEECSVDSEKRYVHIHLIFVQVLDFFDHFRVCLYENFPCICPAIIDFVFFFGGPGFVS